MSYESIRTLRLEKGDLASAKADVMAIGLHEKPKLEGSSARLDRATGGLLKRAIHSGDFKGEAKELTVLYATRGPARWVLLVGLGKAKELDADRIREAAALTARRCRDLGASNAAVELFGKSTPVSAEDAAQAFAEGALLGTYQYFEYRKEMKKKAKILRRLTVLVPDAEVLKLARPGFSVGHQIAEAANYTRTLASHPGNHATPTFLAQEAKRIAADQNLRCHVFDRSKMEKLGMGALLGVAKGSNEPAQFIVLEYHCGEKDAPIVGVVGKGLTFDSGGISIKPAAKMDEMKYDMCGGAAVLGIMSVIRTLKIPIHVVAAIPTTENLSGGSAYKPGDILNSYSGKTIEVLNTDAEGRLILADALSYVARKYKPEAIFEMSTLTGAVVIALGHYGAGLITTKDDLATRLEESSGRTGERLWRLPLWKEFQDHLKSDFADIKNIGDPSAGAGTIVAGAFLTNFVDDVPFAHIDIAGAAWWGNDRPYLPKGPTGYGVRLILDTLLHWNG